MIHIALIDDNPTDIDIGKQYLKAYFKGRCDAANMEINVTSYMDGPSFLADFRPGDLISSFLTSTCPRWKAPTWQWKYGSWMRA